LVDDCIYLFFVCTDKASGAWPENKGKCTKMFDTCQGKLGLNTTAPDPASGFPSNVGLTSTDSSGDEVTETTENPEVSVDPESEQVNV
jgi:hypothetical protein